MHLNFFRNFRRLAVVAILLFFSGNLSFANNNVCSVGTGIPPFLSAGINPNLLLVFENSGSMLETAYTDITGDGACVDNDYIPTKYYAGLFDATKWYRWVEGVQQWRSGATYAVGTYVYTEGVFYKATEVKSTEPVAALDIESDTGVSWERIHEIPSWTSGTVYAAGSFVQFKNQLYYTSTGETASGTEIDETIWVAKESTWLHNHPYSAGDIVSDKGMLFKADAAGISSGTGVFDDTGVIWFRLGEGHFEEVVYATSADAAIAFAGALGTAYQHSDLFIKITSILIDGTSTDVGVSAFAASGNLLNWASASKLDIQKEILTGGKFHQEEKLLISEGRGCSSRPFIKEIPVQSSGGTKVLTFSIRGSNEVNWIDTTDFATRISILGVGEGFIGSSRQEACQDAIDAVAAGKHGDIKQNVKNCLDYKKDGNDPALAASNAAYNHSIHTCWTITKKEYTEPSQIGNVNDDQNACDKIYNAGVPPATIEPWNSGYVCYGVYNDAFVHSERIGYVGRCWEPGSVPEGCVTVPCGEPYNVGDPRCFENNLLHKCAKNYNNNKCPNGAWEPVLVQDETVGSPTCNPSAAGVIDAQWTDDLAGDPTQCIQQALWDYCGSLKIPEVIDPTDQLFNTNETWGIVGVLIDSGVVAMFGTERPLIVMKGYIKAPVDENNEVKLQGKVQEVADDLRIGVMAFNNNGSFTECQAGNTSPTIDRYCPELNRDGAEIIAPIKDSKATTNEQPHLEYLVQAINDIRATSWTPLAEAMYNALGYYGQNAAYRIQEDDFAITSEDDPVQAWCQANNIIFITDGGSSADVNVKVAEKVETVALALKDSIGYSFDPNQEGECSVDGIVPVGELNTNHYLYGSTYFDDLAYFGQNAIEAEIYANRQMTSEDGEAENKQNIRTYVIQTGNAEGSGIENDCNPKILMEKTARSGGTTLLHGEDPDQLDSSLRAALADILSRASAGSAASVVSSARSGAGAIYQAVFWPELVRSSAGVEYKIEWVGDVRSLFVDENGFMYEDTNANRTLDVGPEVEVGARDKRVWIYYDADENMSKGCYEPPTIQGSDERCNASIELENVRFLWSANDWLAGLGDVYLGSNRTLTGVEGAERFNFQYPDNQRRYIFTWVDLNSDGVVDYSEKTENPENFTNEIIALESKSDDPGGWGNLIENFMVEDEVALNELIDWLRGKDQPANEMLRSRQTVRNGIPFTWRLGDVIHSTPTAVTAPGERYYSSYNDISYLRFAQKYKNRRHVVYFGSNSGMLHAVNAGFYSETENKFCLTPLVDNTCSTENVENSTALGLGAELWAYVPYNLLPHLKCLIEPGYTHKYFVDLTPRVFDVQIFTPDLDHPGGWGTILVGGMRFGGTPITVPFKIDTEVIESDIGVIEYKYKPFVSSYFILDITNPEKPPVLLAELTQEYFNPSKPEEGYIWANLGYTTAMPTNVFAKKNPENKWYLVFGSGPTGEDGLKGVSDQQAKISVFPLHNLVGIDNKPLQAMRFPRDTPTVESPGTLFLPDGLNEEAPKGFVSDLLSVDFDTEIRPTGQYITDAIYFGTVEGNFAIDNVSDLPYWQGGGRLNRLVMNGNGHLVGGSQQVLFPNSWQIKPLIDLSANTGQVITVAPTVSTDGYNYWVYFGTGRFFDADDKTDSQQQSYYGIKEPIEIVELDESSYRQLTWGEVSKDGTGTAAGLKGLLKVDEIFVPESGSGDEAQLACRDASSGAPVANDFTCLPTGLNTADTAFFNNLETYIAGSGLCSATNFNNCVDGWYKDFFPAGNRERSLSHAVVTGGMVNFTTYQPYSDVCKAEGEAYLYSVYYRTGTSWFKNIFGASGIEYDFYVRNKLVLGRGLATSPSIFSGSGVDGAISFVQTSTAKIAETPLDIDISKSGPVSWREFQP